MRRHALLHGDLSESVLRCFFEVYNRLCGGLPEHVYVMALERELRWAGHRSGREVSVPVLYKGEELTVMRIDLVVDELLVVEAKSTDVLHYSARRQLYNYLRCTRLEIGLLLHFGPEPSFYRIICPNSSKRHPLVEPTGDSREEEAETADEAEGAPPPEYPDHPS